MHFYCLNSRLFCWGDYRDEVLILTFIKFFLQGFFMESVSRECTALFLCYTSKFSICTSYVLLVSLFCLQICTSIYRLLTLLNLQQSSQTFLILIKELPELLNGLIIVVLWMPLLSQLWDVQIMCNNIAVVRNCEIYTVYKKALCRSS